MQIRNAVESPAKANSRILATDPSACGVKNHASRFAYRGQPLVCLRLSPFSNAIVDIFLIGSVVVSESNLVLLAIGEHFRGSWLAAALIVRAVYHLVCPRGAFVIRPAAPEGIHSSKSPRIGIFEPIPHIKIEICAGGGEHFEEAPLGFC